MIQITVNTCKAFTTEQLFLFTKIFEKLSQLTTMCRDCMDGVLIPEMIKASPDDIRLTDVFVHNNKLAEVAAPCTNDEFMDAIINAMHTTVTVQVNTNLGVETRTLPLFAGYLSTANDEVFAAWYHEPEFIVRTTDGGALEFEFFDSMADFIAEDEDGNITTKLVVGGTEVWSL